VIVQMDITRKVLRFSYMKFVTASLLGRLRRVSNKKAGSAVLTTGKSSQRGLDLGIYNYFKGTIARIHIAVH
jgi:hypothetical protein